MPEEELGRERKYRSYKMRFARCTTCFSALTYMLSITREAGDMTLTQATEMVALTPLARLEQIRAKWPDAADDVGKLLSLYSQFLDRSRVGRDTFVEQLEVDPALSELVSAESTQYTETMLQLMLKLRKEPNAELYRHMVI